jgi:AcrR family transcriptional regulator
MTQVKLATEHRQRQIVEAARRIIATKGMEALTIREIAKEVGMSDGNIYSHFKSKKDLILLLIDDIERTLFEALEQAVSGKGSPLDKLENVLKSHLSYVEQRRGVSLIVISETLHFGDEELRKRMFEVVKSYIARIAEILTQGVDLRQVKKNIDIPTAALNFFALVHTTATIWALSNFGFSLARRHKPLWESYRASIESRASYVTL